MPATNTLPFPVPATAQKTQPDRSFVARWKHPRLFDKGFVAVPSQFLRLYAHLRPFPLSSGEALFVLHLMEFKWDESAPYPSYKTIAARMGVSDKMARRHAQSLETKKYLRRESRIGDTNLFDLMPLFDALAKAADEEAKANAGRKKKASQAQSHTGALIDWLGRLVDAAQVMTDKDRQDLTQWQSKNVGATSAEWPGWERYLGPRPK